MEKHPPQHKQEKGLITIAIGKKYLKQAKYLALSAMLHSPQTLRAVISDDTAFLKDYYDFVVPYNPELGDPFNTKLKIPLYTPFEKTLYIDADSLVFSSLDYYFDILRGSPLLYQGKLITSGNWYMDIAAVIERDGLPHVPKFNSGMLLFNNSERTAAVFETAYSLLKNHRAYGIDYFRGKMLPDEPFFALAFAKHNIEPAEDHGRFSCTLIGAANININVIKGTASFIKEGRMAHPMVVHFCSKMGGFYYIRERLRLFFYFVSPFSALVSALIVFIRDLFKRSQEDKSMTENPKLPAGRKTLRNP